MSHVTTVPGDEIMAVHFRNILHVLRMYDRFENTFLRWSVGKLRDRQELVLTLTENATITQSIVSTICLMYPGRIGGPFLCKNTFVVEFLDDISASTDAAMPQIPSAKRKRNSTKVGGGNIVGITNEVSECIHNLNTSDVLVTKTSTGEDSDGEWLSFHLSESNRINLCFLCNIYTGEFSDAIKVCMCFVNVWACVRVCVCVCEV